MTPTRNLRAAVAILTVLALALLASPVLSAPDAQTNLLQNPGFESGSLSGWEMWAIVNRGQDTVDRCGNWERPVFQINSAEMRSGAYAAHYYTAFASHNAGLYQRVSVTPGTQLRFTIWAKAVSADENYQNPDYTAVWIGIDERRHGCVLRFGRVVRSGLPHVGLHAACRRGNRRRRPRTVLPEASPTGAWHTTTFSLTTPA